jgi:hypothetical protein
MRPRRRLLLIAALAAGGTLGGCSASTTSPSSRSFVIRVDSLTGFTAVSGGVAARQLVWARVGPNGCHRFAGFDVARSGSQMDVTARGELTPGDNCYQVVVELRGEPLRLDPPIPRPLTIVVHQPDGSTLTRQVWGE